MSHLQRKPERLVSGPGGRNDSVKSLEESHAAGLTLLPLHVPALVPGHLLGGVDHVVAVPAGDGDEGNRGGVVADLLDEAGHLLADLLEPGLAVGRLGGVHLVGGHDELLHPEGVSQQGVLSGLTVLGDAGLELTSSGGDDQHSAISLKEEVDQRVLVGKKELFSWNFMEQSKINSDIRLIVACMTHMHV